MFKMLRCCNSWLSHQLAVLEMGFHTTLLHAAAKKQIKKLALLVPFHGCSLSDHGLSGPGALQLFCMQLQA